MLDLNKERNLGERDEKHILLFAHINSSRILIKKRKRKKET